jgi:hypothetical protein
LLALLDRIWVVPAVREHNQCIRLFAVTGYLIENPKVDIAPIELVVISGHIASAGS